LGFGLNGGSVRLRAATRLAIGAVAGFVALSGVAASNVLADPGNDPMAKLSELSRQAEQTTDAHALPCCKFRIIEEQRRQRQIDVLNHVFFGAVQIERFNLPV
jgi:hypothetical protein